MIHKQFLVAIATLVLLAPAVALAAPVAPPQVAPPQVAPPQVAPPQVAPPQVAPPQVAPPAVAPPAVAPPAVAPPQVAPPIDPAAKKAADDKKDADDKKAAEEKKDADDKLKNDVAALRAGKLLTYGITGGVAFAVQVPGPSNYTAAQTSAAVVAMPYVLVLPAYFGTRETTRVACASSWSAASEHDTDLAALGIAKGRAERFFDAIEKTLGATPGAQSEYVVKQLGLDYGPEEEEDPVNVSIVDRIKAYKDLAEGTIKVSTRDSIITWMARMEWQVGRAAVCLPRRIGVWVGLPANYDANTKINEKDVPVERTIKPHVAFGLGWSPNQYFSLLAGFTASSVTVNGKDGATSLDHTIWATTIALGGNLDIASSLVK